MSEDVLSLLDQLSESSEQSISAETAKFTKAMERYQNEAQSIQTTLQALYGQMSQQIRTPRKSPSQVHVTEQMVANLQERIERLDDERKELSEQMNRIANITDLSSSPSRIRSPRIMSSMQLSGLSPRESTPSTSSDIEALRQENRMLRAQLRVERQQNDELKRGFSKTISLLTKQCESFTRTVTGTVKDKVSQIDDMKRALMTAIVRNHARQDAFNHVSSEIASSRAAIADTLDSFKAAMFSAKFMALSSIRSRQSSEPSFRESFTSEKSRSASRSLSPRSPDRRSQLLAMGFDALSSSVLKNFGNGRAVRPVSEMISDSTEFANYITEICQMQEQGIKKLNRDLDAMTTKLDDANEQLKSRSVSKEVVEMVQKVLASLKSVSEEMASQHSALISKLT